MNRVKEIYEYFDDEIKFAFEQIDSAIYERMSEIRIRINQPVVIVIKNRSYFIDYNGDIYDYVTHNSIVFDKNRFDELVLRLCDFSIYSHEEELKDGYIALNNGSRIGISGTALYSDNKISTIKDITSLNIRIPRDVSGCANNILNCLYVNSFPSIIIAGKPNSGKTTILRDMANQLSNGFNNTYRKIAIIDERNEIAGKDLDGFSLNLGINTDVLTGIKKSKGIEIATRALSPEMIICDEIATVDEVEQVKSAFSCGISFALSVHVADKTDLLSKPIFKSLLMTNEFSYIVLLENYTYSYSIIDCSEVLNEIIGNGINNNINNKCRNYSVK